jgi:hypothetical protein
MTCTKCHEYVSLGPSNDAPVEHEIRALSIAGEGADVLLCDLTEAERNGRLLGFKSDHAKVATPFPDEEAGWLSAVIEMHDREQEEVNDKRFERRLGGGFLGRIFIRTNKPSEGISDEEIRDYRDSLIEPSISDEIGRRLCATALGEAIEGRRAAPNAQVVLAARKMCEGAIGFAHAVAQIRAHPQETP